MPPDTAADLFRWTLLVWLTVLGGCVGSFLNVVIFRLPRGESLSHPGSRCPNCGHAIRWYHNIPVVGWLVLRGKCYDCRTPISGRYPLVEGTVAAVFLLLALTGPLSGDSLSTSQVSETGASRAAAAWTAYALETVLLCVLFASALIDRDLQVQGEGRFPFPLVAVGIVLAVCVPILLPVTLVYVHAAGAGPPLTVRMGVEHAAIGLLAGCGCGCLMFAATRGGMANLRQAALPPVAGPYLGAWPTVAVVAATLFAFAAPLLFRNWRPGPWWRWPPLLWAATLAAIISAHVQPGTYARFVDSSLSVNIGVLSGLIVALAVRRVVSRIRPDCVE